MEESFKDYSSQIDPRVKGQKGIEAKDEPHVMVDPNGEKVQIVEAVSQVNYNTQSRSRSVSRCRVKFVFPQSKNEICLNFYAKPKRLMLSSKGLWAHR